MMLSAYFNVLTFISFHFIQTKYDFCHIFIQNYMWAFPRIRIFNFGKQIVKRRILKKKQVTVEFCHAAVADYHEKFEAAPKRFWGPFLGFTATHLMFAFYWTTEMS